MVNEGVTDAYTALSDLASLQQPASLVSLYFMSAFYWKSVWECWSEYLLWHVVYNENNDALLPWHVRNLPMTAYMSPHLCSVVVFDTWKWCHPSHPESMACLAMDGCSIIRIWSHGFLIMELFCCSIQEPGHKGFTVQSDILFISCIVPVWCLECLYIKGCLSNRHHKACHPLGGKACISSRCFQEC